MRVLIGLIFIMGLSFALKHNPQRRKAFGTPCPGGCWRVERRLVVSARVHRTSADLENIWLNDSTYFALPAQREREGIFSNEWTEIEDERCFGSESKASEAQRRVQTSKITIRNCLNYLLVHLPCDPLSLGWMAGRQCLVFMKMFLPSGSHRSPKTSHWYSFKINQSHICVKLYFGPIEKRKRHNQDAKRANF